jgi:hypothetical protein
LEEDRRVMQVGRWWEKVRSKEEWRRIVRGPRPTPGCNAEEEEEEADILIHFQDLNLAFSSFYSVHEHFNHTTT